MKILGRYVLREFLVPLSYVFIGFFSIYVLFELSSSFGRLMSSGAGWFEIARYFVSYFAPQFKWFAPACLMLATLYTMWNFCRHSEIIAMRANGIGFFTIVKPLLMVAAAVAAFTYYVNEVFVPVNSEWAKNFRAAKFKSAEMGNAGNTIFRNPVDNRTWNIGSFLKSDASALANVRVAVDRKEGGRIYTIIAPRADWIDGAWWFTEPKLIHYSPDGSEIPSPVPVADSLTYRTFDFSETPADILIQNRSEMFYSVSDRERYLQLNPSLPEDVRREYEYNIYAQLLAPVACLVITLFAIPAGVATGRQSVFKGILGALGMFFLFYALTIGCMVGAQTGYIPPLHAAILPHALFFAIGLVLFYRQR